MVEKIAFHSLTFVLTANSRPGDALCWGKGPWGVVPRSRPWLGPRARGDLSRGHGAAGTGELSPSVHRGRPPTPGPLTPAASPACQQGGETAPAQGRPSPAPHGLFSRISVLLPPADYCEADCAQQRPRVASRCLRTLPWRSGGHMS